MNDSYLNRLLGQNERVLFSTRQHGLVLLAEVLTETILSIAIVVLITLMAVLFLPLVALGYVLLILPALSFLRDVLIWANRRYVVTNRRVIHVSGVFNKEVTDSSLEKVNDVKMEQSFLGRLFDYGDVEILTASELGANKFTLIARPVRLKTAMLNAKDELEHGDGGEATPNIPTLIGQLEALRRQGVLSAEEFQAKKAALLAKM